MSSVGYSSSPVHWSRWSPSIMAYPQNGQASLAARPSQWRYTPKKSYPVFSLGSLQVPRKWTHSGQSFSWLSKVLGLLDHNSTFFNE
ncbi:hypothetical protein TNCV_3975661 [Trichonephila clavipes]|nr:hypothetical protein TNCV_3975661 [Trichonephila clavipes]